MKVAIYTRISTTKQDNDNQILQMRRYCKEKGYSIFKIYSDSGVSGSTRYKPRYEMMIGDARKKRFNLLLFWALDRISREDTLIVLQKLKQLDDLGIAWKSFTEPIFDTSNELIKDILIPVIASLNKHERKRFSDRIKASYQKKKVEGGSWGRKKLPLDISPIIRKRAEGMSLRQIAETENCSYGTINNLLKKHWKTGLKRRRSN